MKQSFQRRLLAITAAKDRKWIECLNEMSANDDYRSNTAQGVKIKTLRVLSVSVEMNSASAFCLVSSTENHGSNTEPRYWYFRRL
jgi:hypothetical protein